MTRRDAAVLLFVSAGLLSVLASLGYLSGLLEQFAPPVEFPPDFSPALYFASYVIPFGLLLAGGQLLIRARHALAEQVFPDDGTRSLPEERVASVRAFGSLAFAALGLLSLFMAVTRLTAVIGLAQPQSWHSVGRARTVMLSVLHPSLLVAYVFLGWYLLSRRESLAERLLLSGEPLAEQSGPQASAFEAVIRRVLGLYFVMLAIVPLSHSLVRFVARGPSVLTANAWDFWPDAATGLAQLLFGVSVFAGRQGFVSAWQKVVKVNTMSH